MRRPFYLAIILVSAPAAAQEAPPPEPKGDATVAEADAVMAQSVFDGDFLLVGVGGIGMPRYEGSNERTFSPAAGVYGHLLGVDINPRAAGLALDFIPDAKGKRFGFSFGPMARYRANRNGSTKDPVVDRLPRLDPVIEGGFAMGVTLKGVLNGFDRLSAGADFRWDISGKGAGRAIAPGVTYFTPLSKGVVAGARVGAEFVDSKFANYNYAIDPAGSAASGLPQYTAHGGFKEWNLGAFTGFDLNGNFLDGGFAVGAGFQYSRLQGSAADSPITSVRGRRGQWYFGAGIGYTF